MNYNGLFNFNGSRVVKVTQNS